jgi:hypothetical protein
MKKKKFERKISIMVMLEEPEIKFLDRKINKEIPELYSRSAILRLLTRRSMEHPAMLDIK